MALAAQTTFDVRTGGSDTANGGGFNPGNGSFPTDGAATVATGTAPVFTSASYDFVAGDVGAWVFIKSGTNWIPGWYQIASVAAKAATLTATAGTAYKYLLGGAFSTTTANGCASTASPTGATWGIDYSQQNSAQFTFTDMTIGAAGATFTSAGHPVGKNFVGNLIQVTGGTNATAGVYEVISTSGTTATLDRNWATGASSNGAGGLAGAFASPGMAGSVKILSNDVFIGAGTYTLTTTSANVSGGVVSDTTGGTSGGDNTFWVGYNTVRSKMNTDSTRPLIQVPGAGVSSVSIFKVAGITATVRNITIDGASKTSIVCFDDRENFGGTKFEYCKASNCTVGFDCTQTASDNSQWLFCEATTFSSNGFRSAGAGTLNTIYAYGCVAHDGTATGFAIFGTLVRCIAYNNSGGSSDGIAIGSAVNSATNGFVIDCVSRNNGRNGFFFNVTVARIAVFVNCLSVVNGGYGFDVWTNEADQVSLTNCADYNSTSGGYNTAHIYAVQKFITLTADPHTSSSDFSLNNTAGGGADCRAAGIPGVYPAGIATGYPDIGGVQHRDSPLPHPILVVQQQNWPQDS